MIILAPSILSADFANLEKEIKIVTDAGAQYIHVDVMDGHFVPNITIGPCVVSSIRKTTNSFLDVHLMIEEPNKYAEAFMKSGADSITVHHETNPDFDQLTELSNKYGCKLSVSVNPETPVEELDKYACFVDMFLIMSVHPGFGGQSFIKSSIDKIKYLREKYPQINIEVDGGICLENLSSVVDAGANVIVAGSAVFNAQDKSQAVKSFLGGEKY